MIFVRRLQKARNIESLSEPLSDFSDKDLAILSVGLTNKGRHFLLAGLADERLPEVVEISKHIENDINDAEAVAQMIMRKWDKF